MNSEATAFDVHLKVVSGIYKGKVIHQTLGPFLPKESREDQPAYHLFASILCAILNKRCWDAQAILDKRKTKAAFLKAEERLIQATSDAEATSIAKYLSGDASFPPPEAMNGCTFYGVIRREKPPAIPDKPPRVLTANQVFQEEIKTRWLMESKREERWHVTAGVLTHPAIFTKNSYPLTVTATDRKRKQPIP